MNERQNFVLRWFRLKGESELRRKRRTELRESATACSTAARSVANEEETAGTETRATPTFDLTSLPSIESIRADTDISVFLQSGVPAKLTEAALRRAWVSDPAIRDFIGIAENQWDFTNPTAIPGFGPLQEMPDKLSRVAQTAGILDRAFDERAAQFPDTDASAEITRSVTAGLRGDEIGHTALETQDAAATRVIDSKTSNPVPENGHVKAAVQNLLLPGSAGPRRGRHAHGGALPR